MLCNTRISYFKFFIVTLYDIAIDVNYLKCSLYFYLFALSEQFSLVIRKTAHKGERHCDTLDRYLKIPQLKYQLYLNIGYIIISQVSVI